MGDQRGFLTHGSRGSGKRDLLEGLLINAGLCALALGTNVVLDFGLWGRDERSALRSLGASVGAGVAVVYTQVDEATQRQRVQKRFMVRPGHTFPITDSDLAQWRAQFEEPTAGNDTSRSTGSNCHDEQVTPVTRLVTFVDVDVEAPRRMSVSARHEAVWWVADACCSWTTEEPAKGSTTGDHWPAAIA